MERLRTICGGKESYVREEAAALLPLGWLSKIPFTAAELLGYREAVDKASRCLSDNLKGQMAEKQQVLPLKSQKHREANRIACWIFRHHRDIQTRVQSTLSREET